MSATFARGVALATALLACACGGDDEPALTIDVEAVALVPGQAVQLVAEEGGAPAEVAWSSSDPATATVSATGLVEGVSEGLARITATAGELSATVTATVREGAMVGAAGGTVTGRDGGVTVEVPPGAVAEPTPVAVTSTGGLPLDPRVVAATPVTIEIGGTLAEPALLSIAYDRARGPYGLPEGQLRVATLVDEAWSDLGGAEDDVAASRARVAIEASGSYAVRQAEATEPCDAAEDRQFDFWLGAWSLLLIGQGPAQSEILRDEAGCTVDELFAGGGTHGRSVSFYVPEAGLWYQTYVDDAGGRLLLSGGWDGEAMVLRTEGQASYRRITWTVEQGGEQVRQLGERTTNGGESWSTEFEGIYTRR